MKMKKLSLTTCFFLLTLAVGLCLSFGTALTTAAGLLKNFRNFGVTGAVRVMERTVDEVYSRREDCLAAFGLTQRLLGKKETRNFEVLKSDAGETYRDFYKEVMTDEYQDSNGIQEAISTFIQEFISESRSAGIECVILIFNR